MFGQLHIYIYRLSIHTVENLDLKFKRYKLTSITFIALLQGSNEECKPTPTGRPKESDRWLHVLV